MVSNTLRPYKRFGMVNVLGSELEASDALAPQFMGLISMTSVGDSACIVERAEENSSNDIFVSFGYIIDGLLFGIRK